jgi:hypothetical protein
MIANLLTVPLGLWLAYSAIFAPEAGVSDSVLAGAGIAIAVLAIAARMQGTMAWQSIMNIVLGLGLALYAGARWYFSDVGLDTFWTALLIGILSAIGALWSVLYRAQASPVAVEPNDPASRRPAPAE